MTAVLFFIGNEIAMKKMAVLNSEHDGPMSQSPWQGAPHRDRCPRQKRSRLAGLGPGPFLAEEENLRRKIFPH